MDSTRSSSRVSAVIAVCDAAKDPTPTLSSLAAQRRSDLAEVLVVDCLDRSDADRPDEGSPLVRHLHIPGANQPRLKEAAIRAAKADIVAIFDSVASLEPGWTDGLAAAFDDPSVAAVGGSVMIADPQSATSRAIFLFEYGVFNPPLEGGPTEGDLPGINVAYRRSLLLEGCADILDEEGFNKPLCHQRMRELGGQLIVRPEMAVRHRAPSDFHDVVRTRFHYGRCFGATRRRRSTLGKKLLYVAGSPIVPILLVVRHLRRCRNHRSNKVMLAGATAHLIGICVSWGLGEWVGTWCGTGRSSRELR